MAALAIELTERSAVGVGRIASFTSGDRAGKVSSVLSTIFLPNGRMKTQVPELE